MLRGLNIWFPGYWAHRRKVAPPEAVTDVMLCVCDHFEPFHDATREEALARVALWRRHWPQLTNSFTDSDGCGPRHTFFPPIEQYDAEIVAQLAETCRLTGAEVEMQLHHDNDTAENLAQTLELGKSRLREHGLLARDETGKVRYGFVHGNWALDNSHPAGRHCGVHNELRVLQETGCYADFTMPSAPDPTQTRIVNEIYYATGSAHPKSHDQGISSRVSLPKERSRNGSQLGRGEMLLVQGPLGLNFRRRKYGFLPRIENADLTGANPPREDRFDIWLKAGVAVEGRPEWRFIKLHTHGALPRNTEMFLGEAIEQFHQGLAVKLRRNEGWRLHYVTARELVNIVHAAEQGCGGDAGKYRDYLLKK